MDFSWWKKKRTTANRDWTREAGWSANSQGGRGAVADSRGEASRRDSVLRKKTLLEIRWVTRNKNIRIVSSIKVMQIVKFAPMMFKWHDVTNSEK